ncbi:hypothetical protein DOTSEDRAFT_74804 [Dothistroma septosporum NZE10]|uniref:Myb-like domain-containing protein n=1 Tax=Dothistroma septosporum (strain NZE10 / CBS 128990) TaxID=675120 RepID=N1PD88_DOTSN|nr:hypothetical protein DOTSEDRAFT_74804 [Dothistroma septosporum NZE10]
MASSKCAGKKPSHFTVNSTRVGPFWGKVPIHHSAAESAPKRQKSDGPAMRRDSRVSRYQTFQTVESICSAASESMSAQSTSEKAYSKTKQAPKVCRSAKVPFPNPPTSSTSRPKKKLRVSTKSDSREWTKDDKATLKSLRDPSRPGGPVKYQDIANMLVDQTNAACRLQCDKMRKTCEWPWSKDDVRKGKELK